MASSEDQNPETLEDWAKANHLGLTLVFTDIVESTDIGIKLGDTKWIEDLFTHFSKARTLALWYDCHVVKVIGDSLMMAFRTSSEAVDFATEFAVDTAIDYIGIRVGINSGEVQIRENDIYGLNVNFTSRVQHASRFEGILVSNSVKRDYEKTRGTGSDIQFKEMEKELKSFGKEYLWLAQSESLTKAVGAQRKARARLLGKMAIPPWVI
jgi:class 3 adenylate cyclase